MANARIAASSLMDTVTNTANMLSSVVNVAADSVNMLGGYVSKHRIMQQKRTLIELDNFENILVEETTLANVKRHETIEQFVTENESRRTKWNAEYERLSNLLSPKPQAEPASA
jgi:vancomycin resistance protein YoaR